MMSQSKQYAQEEVKLSRVVLETKTEEEVESLLRVLLTLSEFTKTEKRWPIISMLVARKGTQVDIATECGVSQSTVGDLRERLDSFGSALRLVIERTRK
jgi:Trp operon repressor